MTWRLVSLKALSGGLRLKTLVAVILLQSVSALFFIGDFFWEFRTSGLVGHTAFEGLATVGLVLGVVFGIFEIRHVLSAAKRTEDSLRIAANAFGEMIRDRFSLWSLTDSEQEVALLTLKGFNVEEIANLRKTATGTVRAQQASIYAKSNTRSRGEFISSFIDVLVETPVIPAK